VSWYDDNQDIEWFVDQLPEACVTVGKCVMLSNGNPGCVDATAEACEDAGTTCAADGVSMSGCVLGWTHEEIPCDDLCSANSFVYDLDASAWTFDAPEATDYEGRTCESTCTGDICIAACITP
jgi:hypothetical protein